MLAIRVERVTATVTSGHFVEGRNGTRVNLSRLADPAGRPIPASCPRTPWCGSAAGVGFVLTFVAAVPAARRETEDPEALAGRFRRPW